MVDIFDTKGIIRVEYDESTKQTLKKYNNVRIFSPDLHSISEELEEVVTLDNYNSFIKSIEPNLNKILFSKKVILAEGPNDIMAYKYAIEKKVESLGKPKKYAQTYLNFLHIAIVSHHGKATALLLIDLCKHMGLDYFAINDWDFDINFTDTIVKFNSEVDLKASEYYMYDNGIERTPTKKSMITTNWKLINKAGKEKIHFNIPKLEAVLGYNSDDKNSVKLWKRLNDIDEFNLKFFPDSLCHFLEFDNIVETEERIPVAAGPPSTSF